MFITMGKTKMTESGMKIDDAFLVPPDLEENDELQAAVFVRTLGVIRRRRRTRRCVLTAGLLGCYLAGAMTVSLWPSGEKHSTGATIAQRTAKQKTQPTPATVAARDDDRQRPPPPKLSGYEHWRRLGDHFLRDYNNISLATQSYSQALALATEEERATSTDRDTWLLLALKKDKLREKQHASL